MKDLLSRTLRTWLPLAIGLTGVCALAFVLVQQDYRQSANDPQIQIVEDVAAILAQGHTLQEVMPADVGIDIAKSLRTFMAVYDATGTPIASSMKLGGKLPTPPKGVFSAAKSSGIDLVTWQPQSDVRQALVVVPYSSGDGTWGYIASGRSLREVEIRIRQAHFMTLGAWLFTLVVTFIATNVLERKRTSAPKVEATATVPPESAT